jgi:hypothetical protein
MKRPRRFRLRRYQDISGVSGTGHPAEGVLFSTGAVALHWTGKYAATAVWPDIDSVIAVHGHGGATVIEWMDDEDGNPIDTATGYAASSRT